MADLPLWPWSALVPSELAQRCVLCHPSSTFEDAYSKYHHERQREAKVAAKRAREAHRPTKVVTPRIGIATNDLERKLAQVRSFLDAGAAVRVRVEGQIRPSAGEGLLDEVQSVFAQLARSDRQARAVLLVPRS